jgi:L-iditol 2-dehydrogenase
MEVPLEFSPLRRKELALFNVRRSNQDSEDARDLLVSHLTRFAAIITHTRPLVQIADAFRQAEHYSGGVGKMVVLPAAC